MFKEALELWYMMIRHKFANILMYITFGVSLMVLSHVGENLKITTKLTTVTTTTIKTTITTKIMI